MQRRDLHGCSTPQWLRVAGAIIMAVMAALKTSQPAADLAAAMSAKWRIAAAVTMIVMMQTTMTWTRDRMATERAVAAVAAVLTCPCCQLDAMAIELRAL